MKQIRNNVFETNSSSTHVLAICSESEYKDWEDGKILFNSWEEKFVKNPIQITERDKIEAEKRYRSFKGEYYKDWSELTEELKAKYIYQYVSSNQKVDSGEECLTKRQFVEKYCCEGLSVSTTNYTTPLGEKIVITCAYGYE